MTTEQALDYFKSDKEEINPVVESTEPSTEDSKSEEMNVNSPDEVATNSNDGEHTTEEVKGSDEPKTEDVEDVKSQNNDTKSKRDYAFIKLKNKNKALKDKYERDIADRDKTIKEMEEALNKYKGLSSRDFKNDDGSVNNDAYVDWKFKEQDMMRQVEYLKKEREQQQLQHDIEQDRIITESCFEGQDLIDYDNLIKFKGQAFAEACHDFDKSNTLFKYLDTVQHYPIVLKELMSNPGPYLNRIYRSKDPDTIKDNARKIVNEILDNHFNSKSTVSKEQPKSAIPVIGKQITNAGASGAKESTSLVSSMNSINNYLRKHK